MLTLEKLLRIYMMPPGRGGQSGNRGGGKSGGSSSSGGGGKSSNRGSVSGATRGNIGAKTGGSKSSNNNSTRGGAYSASTSRAQNRKSTPSKSTPTSSSNTYSGPKGTPQGGLNAAAKNAYLGNNQRGSPNDKGTIADKSKRSGISIDIRSKNAPNTAGIDEGQYNTGQHSPGIDAAPALDTDSYSFNNSKDEEEGLLSKIGDGFRQMAIDTFGAEPGVEGYDSQGNYGYGWNSSYGQELLAGVSGVRAKGDLDITAQQRMADNYKKYGTANTAGLDDAFVGPPSPGIFDGFFDVDTDSIFGKIAKNIAKFAFGQLGATLLKGFGPVGIIAGTLIGKYMGGKLHDYFTSGDFKGGGGAPNSGGPGGAGEDGPDKPIIPIVPNNKVVVVGEPDPDAPDDGPTIKVKELDTLLDELENDYSAERDAVKTEQRQGRVLDRIVAARQPLGTYNNNLVY